MAEPSASNTRVLEQVIKALEDEKALLLEKLDAESEDLVKQEIEDRIAEIYADLEIHRVGLQEPPSQAEKEVRRSVRVRRPTEKMLELNKEVVAKSGRSFMYTYMNFKAEVQLIRSKLKKECSKIELGEMIIALEKFGRNLQQEYESLRAMTVPLQDIRRKMDNCTSVTSDIILLLKTRYAEVGTKEFDPVAVKQSLLQLLKREDARSIYGTTVSRAGQSSHQSTGSHVSAKKADAAARLAAKRAEINREKEIIAQKREVQAQQEKLKMLEDQRDLEAMEAEFNVYAEEEAKLNAEIGDPVAQITLPPSQPSKQHTSTPIAQVTKGTLPSSYTEGKLGPETNETLLVQALKEFQAMTRLPAPEPFVFSGDPLKFTEWSTCFKALIETSCTDPAHRLFYLKKYISGDALCVLEGAFYRSDEEAYSQAWDALNKRYGHPFVIQRAFRGKLNSWPKIGSKESLKLRELSDFLISCKNAMPHVAGLKVLDDCEENQKLLQKLPDWATTRWNRYVSKELDEGKLYPNFAEFADFVAEEASIACNPISSLHALKYSNEKPDKEHKRLKASTLVTSMKVSQTPKPNSQDSDASETGKGSKISPAIQTKRQIECVCCQKDHFIYKCDKFAAMSLDEKKKFVRGNSMCFGCLRVGHISKNCKKKKGPLAIFAGGAIPLLFMRNVIMKKCQKQH